VSEKVPFWLLLKSGEKPAFQKGNFSANILPLFEELASVNPILQALIE
jgi:hypothetical protein